MVSKSQQFKPPLLSKRYLTTMRLRCNQEEVLKLHTLRRRALRQANTLTFSEEERNCVPQLHARQMDANARPCAHTEGMERCFGGGRECFGGVAFFGGDPSLWVKAG
jgi:hypothetical protein